MRRLTTAMLFALGCLAAAPAGASAGHVQASGSASFKLEKRARECGRNSVGIELRCGWRGSYDARLDWSASCSDGSAPDVGVNVNHVSRGGRVGANYEELVEQTPSGSALVRVTPGLRLEASVEVTCSGDDHSASTTAVSPRLLVRPHLDGHALGRSTVCGPVPRGQRARLTLQARQYATVAYGLRFSANALLRPGSLAARLRQIKLYSGASRRGRTPDIALYREFGDLGVGIRPRRRGRLKLWAVVGGVRTNTATAPVIGLPRGCVPG